MKLRGSTGILDKRMIDRVPCGQRYGDSTLIAMTFHSQSIFLLESFCPGFWFPPFPSPLLAPGVFPLRPISFFWFVYCTYVGDQSDEIKPTTQLASSFSLGRWCNMIPKRHHVVSSPAFFFSFPGSGSNSSGSFVTIGGKSPKRVDPAKRHGLPHILK